MCARPSGRSRRDRGSCRSRPRRPAARRRARRSYGLVFGTLDSSALSAREEDVAGRDAPLAICGLKSKRALGIEAGVGALCLLAVELDPQRPSRRTGAVEPLSLIHISE